MQQLTRLHVEKSRVKKQHKSLIKAKMKNNMKLSSVGWELEALKKDNALLKNDKSLLQSNDDRLAESISAKDKKLEAANEQASLAVQGRA